MKNWRRFVENSSSMSQVVLELDNRDDLALLLSLVRRLNINIVTVRPSPKKTSKRASKADCIERMRRAASDPLFLADIEEVAADFEHSDNENADHGN